MWAAVLGSPISHSLSPVLHRAAYAHLQLTSWHYEAIECTTADLPGVIRGARDESDFGGYSLTMPLKISVLPLLDELEPLAQRVAAVNTVVKRDGILYGANTDVPGMVNALREAGVTAVANPLVLGGGGSAQAALAAVALLGASKVRVAVRNRARAEGLSAVAARCSVELTIADWDPALLEGSDLVISAVPGSAAHSLREWGAGWSRDTTLFDLVYAPWPTPLAAAARLGGARVLGGLDLLVHQAVGQIALMTGRVVEVEVLREAGERALRGR